MPARPAARCCRAMAKPWLFVGCPQPGVPQALEIMPKPVPGTAGNIPLAPAAWHGGLRGSPCPVASLPAGHRGRHPSAGRCAPPGGEMAPAGVPELFSRLVWCWMSLWPLCSEKGGSWGCQAQGRGRRWVLCPHPADTAPLSALTPGQIRIRDPNQGGKDITEEIMSGARTSSTPTPPQVSGPPFPRWGVGMCPGPQLTPPCSHP